MSDKIPSAGRFRAKAIGWELKRSQTGAVNVAVTFQAISMQEADKTWTDWISHGSWTIDGFYNLVQKNGTLNEINIEQLMRLGWDGTFSRIQAGPPEPDFIVQITVELDTYKDKNELHATWINANVEEMSTDDAKKLDNQFGGLMRAMGKAPIKPAGKPGAPPAKQVPPKGKLPDGIAPVTAEEIQQVDHGEFPPEDL